MDKTEQKQSSVILTGAGHGFQSKITVNGNDLSSLCRTVTVRLEAGKIAVVTLELIPSEFICRTDAYVALMCDHTLECETNKMQAPSPQFQRGTEDNERWQKGQDEQAKIND